MPKPVHATIDELESDLESLAEITDCDLLEIVGLSMKASVATAEYLEGRSIDYFANRLLNVVRLLRDDSLGDGLKVGLLVKGKVPDRKLP